MERKIISFVERDELDEDFNDYVFYHSLFERHKEILNKYPLATVKFIKNYKNDLFVFTNGEVDTDFIKKWILYSNNKIHSIAKKELDSVFLHDITNACIYNVNLVVSEEIEEFEISTDNFKIIFRNDKVLFIPIENDTQVFSISIDYLVLWYEFFRM